MSFQFTVTFLCCLALLISLESTTLVKAAAVPDLEECKRVAANSTEGNPLYSLSL